MSIGLLGQKIGMTSVYNANGRLCPVIVIAAGDNVLLRRLTGENEGYSAVQVGFGAQKESRVTKQLLGDERVTVQNLQVMQVRETEKLILISGAVPGANGSYVVVRRAIKKPVAARK